MKRPKEGPHEHRGWISPGTVAQRRGRLARPGDAKEPPPVPAVPAALIRGLAGRLLRVPTAPCHEQGVRSEVERVCREHGLSLKRDVFGNTTVSLNTAPRLRPLVLAAHLDHPGFEIVGARPDGSWHARFLGGVPDSYFKSGTPVRLQPGDGAARLGQRLAGPKDFVLRPSRPVREQPVFAVWDVEPFVIRDGQIRARSCDDVVGCAAALATLIHLRRIGARVNVRVVLSRAEEIGFYGALALAARGDLPRHALVISLETSKEVPPIAMGQGAIIRVGDRASVFDPAATRFLGEVASGLQSADRRFTFQRALMSGGTCEATAYLEHGYQATGLCVALGHYHNCGPGNRIAEEFVSFEDVRGMVRLLAATAVAMPRFKELTGRLRLRLDGLQQEAEARLRP